MDSDLRTIVAEVLGVPPESIREDTSTQTEARWDSLKHMNLVFALEDRYEVRFDDAEIPELTSIAAIESALASRR